MSVQVKGSGTIGGLDEGLVVSGIVTSSTQINVGSNIRLGNAGVITATSFVGGLPITNGADNRVITASSASALNGESQLLFTGTNLGVGDRTTSPDEKLHVHTGSGEVTVHVEGATHANLNLRSHSGDSTIKFSDASATNVGNINYDHGTDSLAFRTNSSERVRIDSTGKLLIGTTIEGNATGDDLTISNAGNMGLTLRSTNSSYCNIYFSDATSGTAEYEGYISYNHGTDSLEFATGHTERLRIDSSGRLLLGTTTEGETTADNLTIADSGHCGITIRSGTSSEGNIFFSDGTSGADEYRGIIRFEHSTNAMVFKIVGDERVRIESAGNIIFKRGGISATPSVEIFGSGNASDADADNLRFHNWGNSSGDYWQIGVNSTLDGNGNNAKPSTTLKGAAIRLNAKNGKVTLITSPSSTSTQYEGLSQNENGIVTIPQQPSFHARRTTNQSAMANPLVFDSAHHNNGSHYKTSGSDQGKFVAPVSGVYLFYWTAIKTTNGSVTRLYINVDGSHIYGSMHLRLQESGTYSNGSMQAIVNLNAGQKVHISLEVGAIHGSEYTHFGGYLIG